MGYPEKLLARGEKIAFEFKPHWRAIIVPAVVLLATAFFGTWLYFSVVEWLQWLILGVAVILLIWQVLIPLARWVTTQYVFTTRRIIVRAGLLTKHGRDMPLSKVNNVSFSISVMGRILNYGSLELESASDDGDMVIAAVPNVEQIQRTVYELHELDDSRRRSGEEGDDRLPEAQ